MRDGRVPGAAGAAKPAVYRRSVAVDDERWLNAEQLPPSLFASVKMSISSINNNTAATVGIYRAAPNRVSATDGQAVADDSADVVRDSGKESASGSEASSSQEKRNASNPNLELDRAELAQVRELKAIDKAVRAHEAAHAAVGGSLAGAKSFSYVTGPDGVRYAVAGEVAISFGGSSDPAVTMQNAAQVRAAALAPADPSAQDQRVAAQAQQIIIQAAQELAQISAQQSIAGEVGGVAEGDTRAKAAVNLFAKIQSGPNEASVVDQIV